jgi:predicted outer membrane repeat protein
LADGARSSTISNNTAANVNGGGIYSYGGSVTLNGSSTISNNTAANGGGIFNSSGLGTLNNCVAGVNVYNNTPNDIAP